MKFVSQLTVPFRPSPLCGSMVPQVFWDASIGFSFFLICYATMQHDLHKHNRCKLAAHCDIPFLSHCNLTVQSCRSSALVWGTSICNIDVAKLGQEWTNDATTVLAMSFIKKGLMKLSEAVIRFAHTSVIFKKQKSVWASEITLSEVV
jgi:hypothetical protein